MCCTGPECRLAPRCTHFRGEPVGGVDGYYGDDGRGPLTRASDQQRHGCYTDQGHERAGQPRSYPNGACGPREANGQQARDKP